MMKFQEFADKYNLNKGNYLVEMPSEVLARESAEDRAAICANPRFIEVVRQMIGRTNGRDHEELAKTCALLDKKDAIALVDKMMTYDSQSWQRQHESSQDLCDFVSKLYEAKVDAEVINYFLSTDLAQKVIGSAPAETLISDMPANVRWQILADPTHPIALRFDAAIKDNKHIVVLKHLSSPDAPSLSRLGTPFPSTAAQREAVLDRLNKNYTEREPNKLAQIGYKKTSGGKEGTSRELFEYGLEKTGLFKEMDLKPKQEAGSSRKMTNN